MGRDAEGRSLGVRAALRQKHHGRRGAVVALRPDHWHESGHYSTTVNGTSGVTSTADVSRRGSPLLLRASNRHSTPFQGRGELL
jgi:hypothetical protein